MKVAVLMGGASDERHVSLASGVQVARALREVGHEVTAVDTSRGVLSGEEEGEILDRGVDPAPPEEGELEALGAGESSFLARLPDLRDHDLIFPALHGGRGEDGTLQAVLDLAHLPYAGSGRLGCTLAMDKEVSKRLFRDAGISTPDWRVWSETGSDGLSGGSPGEPSLEEVEEALGYPVIVKPPSGGSTLGLTLAHDRKELIRAVRTAGAHEDRILFEAYVEGRELTVGLLGREPLPVGEIIPAHELFDYECKYQPGLAEEIFPASIPPPLAERLQELALQVHDLLHLRDFSRVDFMVDGEGVPWCLEANALPGLTANSLLPKAARAGGLPFSQLCGRILELAADRYAQGAAGVGTWRSREG